MFTVEEVWEAQDSIYNQMQDESEEYCHHTSFRWGFERGVDWAEKKVIDKAINYLYQQLNNGTMECGDMEKFISNLKEYMEE